MKKKTKRAGSSELRAEYDFAAMKGGVRGKYAERVRKASNLVLLDPDVAAAFPTDEDANEALRLLLKASKRAGRAGARPAKPVGRVAEGRR